MSNLPWKGTTEAALGSTIRFQVVVGLTVTAAASYRADMSIYSGYTLIFLQGQRPSPLVCPTISPHAGGPLEIVSATNGSRLPSGHLPLRLSSDTTTIQDIGYHTQPLLTSTCTTLRIHLTGAKI